MHTQIDLLRHGETEGGEIIRGSIEKPLTPRGHSQMQAQVERVRDTACWQRIVSSPQQRCQPFAEALASTLDVPLQLEPRLREISFGDWEGRRIDELLAENPETLHNFWQDPWRHGPPNGEPMDHFQQRVLAAWAHLLESCRGERVLVVTHGAVIRILLVHVLAAPVHSMQRLQVPFGSLSRIQVGRAGPQLLFHGVPEGV